MEIQAEASRKIQKRAKDMFDLIIKEEKAKQNVIQMEEHTEISRKIQRRARSEFDKIIAQHTINKNAKSSEEKITGL